MLSATRPSVVRPVAEAARSRASVEVVLDGPAPGGGTASTCWRRVVVVRTSSGPAVVVVPGRVVGGDDLVVALDRAVVVGERRGAVEVVDRGATVVVDEVTLVGGTVELVVVDLDVVVVVDAGKRIAWASAGPGPRLRIITTAAPATARALVRLLRISIAGMVGGATLAGARQRWWWGHDHEVRPPMVRRTSAVPSRGHRPSATRSGCSAPVWDPPPAMRSSSVVRRWRWSRRTSAGESEPAGRAGSSPARYRTSSAVRLPTPANRDWSISRTFRGAALAARMRRRPAVVTAPASTPRRDSAGSSTTPPSRRGSRTRRSPPSAKRIWTRSHASSSLGLEYSRWSTPAAPSTSSRPVMPKRSPRVGPPSVSSRSSLPIRRAVVKVRPSSASASSSAVSPSLRNQASGAWTAATGRPRARHASRR